MKLIIALASGLASCSIYASPVVARIDGEPLYALTLDVVKRSSKDGNVLERLIENRLLARWVRASFNAAHLYPATTVGFDRKTAQDDQLTSTLRGMYGAETDLALKDLERVIVETYTPQQQALEQVFGRPGELRLAYDLDTQRLTLASRLPLIKFSLPGAAPATLSIADILRRQNVQGRMEFFNRNTDFMLQQARARVAGLVVLDWANRRFGAGPIADLRQALAEQDDVRAAMALYGLAEGAEAASQVQTALARQVSQAEIDAYYKAHKDQFRRLERVRARHITVATEELAKAIVDEARSGKDFAALARKHSIAADARSGGSLGWITHAVDPGWLAALALQQPQGQVSNPLRAPVGADQAASWEIVLVERRVEGYHPAGSETVRYMARQAIAHQKAGTQFAAARRKAVAGASIEIAGKSEARQ